MISHDQAHILITPIRNKKKVTARRLPNIPKQMPPYPTPRMEKFKKYESLFGCTTKVTTRMLMVLETNGGQEYKSTLRKTALGDGGKTCMRKSLPNFLAITGVVSARQKEGNGKSQLALSYR